MKRNKTLLIFTVRQEGKHQQQPKQRRPRARLRRLQLRAAKEEMHQLNISWCHHNIHLGVCTKFSSCAQCDLGCTVETFFYECPQPDFFFPSHCHRAITFLELERNKVKSRPGRGVSCFAGGVRPGRAGKSLLTGGSSRAKWVGGKIHWLEQSLVQGTRIRIQPCR